MLLPNYYRNSVVGYRNAASLIREDLATNIIFENDGLQPAGSILTIEFNGLDQTYFYATVIGFSDDFAPSVTTRQGLNTTIGTNTFTLDNPVDFRRGNYIQTPNETKRILTKTSPSAGTVSGNWLFNNVSSDWALVSFSYAEQPCQIAYVDKQTVFFSLVDGDFVGGTEALSYSVPVSVPTPLSPRYDNMCDGFVC